MWSSECTLNLSFSTTPHPSLSNAQFSSPLYMCPSVLFSVAVPLFFLVTLYLTLISQNKATNAGKMQDCSDNCGTIDSYISTLSRRCSVHTARSREGSHSPGAAVGDVPRPEARYDAERVRDGRASQVVQRHDDKVERQGEATSRTRQTSLPGFRQVRYSMPSL